MNLANNMVTKLRTNTQTNDLVQELGDTTLSTYDLDEKVHNSGFII